MFIKKIEIPVILKNFNLKKGFFFGKDLEGLFASSGWTCNNSVYVYRLQNGAWVGDWEETHDFDSVTPESVAILDALHIRAWQEADEYGGMCPVFEADWNRYGSSNVLTL